MNWYYADQGLQLGPIAQDEFDLLVQAGKIGPDTLVWHDGLKDWEPYRRVTAEQANLPKARVTCTQCLRDVSEEEAIRYRDAWVCASCKPIFFQKVREGQSVTGGFEYIGFWTRAGAKLVDGLIVGVAIMIVFVPYMILSFKRAFNGGNPDDFRSLYMVMYPVVYGLNIGYGTFFLGKYGATPGKMLLGIRVITSDGGSLTYTKALVRSLADLLSKFICYIGYLMVAFDKEEHKALHDMICDTRVVRK